MTNVGSLGAHSLDEEADNKEINNKEELFQIAMTAVKKVKP